MKKWVELISKDRESQKADFESGRSFVKNSAVRSIMDKHIYTNRELCYKVSGIDITGRSAWYFVLIRKEKLKMFLQRKKGDNYNLEDYGQIIISGYGDHVPEEICEMLREKYDFDSF